MWLSHGTSLGGTWDKDLPGVGSWDCDLFGSGFSFGG